MAIRCGIFLPCAESRCCTTEIFPPNSQFFDMKRVAFGEPNEFSANFSATRVSGDVVRQTILAEWRMLAERAFSGG